MKRLILLAVVASFTLVGQVGMLEIRPRVVQELRLDDLPDGFTLAIKRGKTTVHLTREDLIRIVLDRTTINIGQAICGETQMVVWGGGPGDQKITKIQEFETKEKEPK